MVGKALRQIMHLVEVRLVLGVCNRFPDDPLISAI